MLCMSTRGSVVVKIHSNVIETHNISAAAKEAGVGLARNSLAGSRSYRRAFDVILTGSARHKVMHNPHIVAATYDEWGWFISYLYDIDTDAKIGPYKHSADFAEKTEWKFDTDA